MYKRTKALAIGLVASLALFGCSGSDGSSDKNGGGSTGKKTLTLQGGDQLPKLGSDYVWEGWIVGSDGPKSTGRFSVEDGKSTYEWNISSGLAETATSGGTFVLTIEPKQGDEAAPSKTKMLAGTFDGSSATATTAGGPALGTDFADASGTFLLNTPSDDKPDNYKYGIWFLEAGNNGKTASLDLPELPEGWTYEGWVAKDGSAWTTGTFTAAEGFDADKAGASGGSKDGPPFPGQDFVKSGSKRDLTNGYKAVISVEPKPDNSEKPFALKPLAGSISDAGKGASQELMNNASPPSVTVSVE